MTLEEQFEAVCNDNARLSKLLAISEFQKERLKKQVKELTDKIREDTVK